MPMKYLSQRLGLLLLIGSLGSSSGCFGLSQNPSYIPNLWPTMDVVATHAKPGLGYYSNFDPNAVRLEVRPLDSTNPVRSQHVLIATIYDKDGTPRRNRRVEWMIEGVGHIIEVDESGLFHRGYKTGRQHAVSATAYFENRVTRGNENANDDFMIRPGQTWCIISSAVEGDTHVTISAPGVANWEKSKVYTTLRWVDAGWEFPPPAQARVGTQHVFTTKVFRHTDKQPLSNYRVRYKILDGPPAAFIPSQTQEYVAISDLAGNAQVAIGQVGQAFGVNRIGIEIIRPPDPNTPAGSAVSIGRGETSIEWLAPAASLSHTGPATANVGSEVTYDTTVNNVGKVESRSMTITSPVAEGLQYLRSQPPAFVDGRNLVWTLGALPPGQAHKVQATFKTLQQGQITSCASVATEEGLKDQKCTTTNVVSAALKVGISGPQTAMVGSPVTFQITLTNPGSGPLDNILLTATYTDGLEHQSKARTLNLSLPGSLAGQETRTLPLELIPRLPGNQTVQIMASAGNLSDQAQAVVVVQQPQVSLTIDGPRTKFVGRPAEWNLVLSNPSDVAINNVVVRDRLPVELGFVNADQGGRLENNEVLWSLGQLQPREKRVLKLTTTGKVPAKAAVQTAMVTADAGLRADAQAVLEILSTPAALKLEMGDRGDPVQVGKNVTYVIKVTNTGMQPANQIEVKVVVPPELKVVDAKGPSQGQTAGQMVTFARIDNVDKDRPLEFTIEAQAMRPGDVRFSVELRAQGINPADPIREEESTRIYDTGQAAPPPPVIPPPPPPPGL
jgi:uncharacterized repeat protein (TIGR01451 family)